VENNNEEVIYDGFSTPSLILESSDKTDRGSVIDQYAKTKEQDGLLCGKWAKGMEDGLIHVWLIKPVAAICDEREEWVAKMMLKPPIDYMPKEGAVIETSKPMRERKATPAPKRKVVLDPVTKQFHLEI